MRSYQTILAVFSAVLLATQSSAQRTGVYTTTLPYADGNTEIVSVGTNALGLATTAILSTLGLQGNGALTTATATTATTTSTRRTTTTTAARTTTTVPAVVGNTPTTYGPPMKTTTYNYPGPDGVWVEATWTASVTALPTVATVVVPAGTIQDYNSYQASANSVVLASALASASKVASGAVERVSMGVIGGWVGMVAGAVGAGWGLMMM